MYRRSFFWTLAHTWLSLLFGLLLFALLGRMLAATVEVPSHWYASLAVLCLLLGNPFFKLVRYKNGIAVGFFVLLALWDVTISGQVLVFFLVLVCARRKLHNLELYERDLQLVLEGSPRQRNASAKDKSPQAASKARSYKGMSILVKPLRAISDAIVDLLLLALTPAATRLRGNHIDPSLDVFTFFTVWPRVNDHHGWNMSPSMFDFQSDAIGVNPASGLPMASSTMDVMGNPFGTNLASSLDFASSDPFSGI